MLAQGESHVPGRSQEQKGKKRKNDFGKHGKAFKKRKEGVKQVLNSVGKQIPRLTKKIENQENLVDKLLHQKTVHLFLVVRLLTYFLSTDDFEIRIYHLRV